MWCVVCVCACVCFSDVSVVSDVPGQPYLVCTWSCLGSRLRPDFRRCFITDVASCTHTHTHTRCCEMYVRTQIHTHAHTHAQVGKASPTEGTLPGSIYFILKYQGDLAGAIKANAMVGGPWFCF